VYKFKFEHLNNENLPSHYQDILDNSNRLGFDMCCNNNVGALIRLLASTKPSGTFLEIGTGTGLGTSFLLDGMDCNSRLISIDSDQKMQSVAKTAFKTDNRLSLICIDGLKFLQNCDQKFDLIFADAWPGKYEYVEETIKLLKPGGIFIVDDMLPQDDWPEEHYKDAHNCLEGLKNLSNVNSFCMEWGSGILMFTNKVKVNDDVS
jgi:predicted O-methyltransferase YrrM